MYSKLTDMVNQGRYDDVLIELEKYSRNEYTEELTIIAVSALLAVGNYKKAHEYLQIGLQINDQSDELYLLLGNYFEQYNLAQAYLCYENAELYCRDMQDREIILSFKRGIEGQMDCAGITCRNISIVLLCFSLEKIKRCIESIRKNILSYSYEIVAVCPISMKSSLKWLEQQKDVVLVKSAGSIEGSNGYVQGIEAANPETDIFLLDSNLELLSNSLFWLRMALYKDEKTGAAGCHIHGQFVQEISISIKDFCESKFYLDKLAMLIRREALNEIGILCADSGQCELWEKDFGLRLFLTGWKYVLCHNSCIYHSEIERERDTSTEKKFGEKRPDDNLYDEDISDELIEFINADKNNDIYVLQVGCGIDEKLKKIQVTYPNAQVYGIDFLPEEAVDNSKFLHVARGDFEGFNIPFGNRRFDYIIVSGVLKRFQDPEKAVRKLLTRLKSNGTLICSIPNFINLSTLYSLMKSEIKYEGTDLLNQNHLDFFDLNHIRRLFDNCGVYIDKIKHKNIDLGEMDEEFHKSVNKIFENEEKKEFLAQQYIFCVRSGFKEFKITAVGLIKNAADVIETYIRANGLLVDHFVLLNNMCSDRTIPILEQLKEEGFEIEIIKDEIIEHNQSEKMRRLIYYVNEKYHPDFIIPIDDDEFIAPSSEEYTIEKIRYKISRLSPKNLYYLKWKIYIPTEYDDENEICVAKRQTYCCEDTEEVLNKVIIPSKILEDGTFSIVAGNHGGSGNLIQEHILLPFACMAHFPCRSEAQLRSKVLTGWTNCLAFPGRRAKDALQWRIMYSIAKKGDKLSLNDMRKMVLLYVSVSNPESVYIYKEPVNMPDEAMLIKYTGPNEVNPWENYCTNVETLAQRYAELVEKKLNEETLHE